MKLFLKQSVDALKSSRIIKIIGLLIAIRLLKHVKKTCVMSSYLIKNCVFHHFRKD